MPGALEVDTAGAPEVDIEVVRSTV